MTTPKSVPKGRPYDRFDIDHEKRRIVMVAGPGFGGRVISQATARMIRDDPRTASYDFVLDTTKSDVGGTPADLDIVLAAYHSVPRGPGSKFGCYVTADPYFHMWAAAMDGLFGDRTCLTFATMRQATDFLDKERS